MKIAVIGSGISGMGAAYALSGENDVTLFERDSRFGGHANTIDVTMRGREIPVDTGFIVYNTDNYPNLTALFDDLGVPTKESDMSFAFSLREGRTEYACDTLNELFIQRRNIFNPRYIRGMLDVLRWNRDAQAAFDDGSLSGMTLGEYLDEQKFSDWFRNCFLLPFGGAIWSTPTGEMQNFPAENIVNFFRNHELMNGMAPAKRWRTVAGGSREYVSRLIGRLGAGARAGLGVRSITRAGGRPVLTLDDGTEEVFDQVVIASHGPQALAMLSDADPMEREILSAFRTSQNRAILHSDPRLMPRRQRIWSSWNFLSGGPREDWERPAPITYWMNRLQGIDRDYPLFVSLNPRVEPDPTLVHREFNYAHPLFNQRAFDAQKEIDAIQGRGGVWYAGAWLGYGFHEDGLKAAVRVAAALGSRPDWACDIGDPIETPLAAAAE